MGLSAIRWQRFLSLNFLAAGLLGGDLFCARLFSRPRFSRRMGHLVRSFSLLMLGAFVAFSVRRLACSLAPEAASAQGPAGYQSRDSALKSGSSAFANHRRTATGLPITSCRTSAARPALTAISARPFEFSYQKASPAGTSEKVRACFSTRPDTASLASLGKQVTTQPRHCVAILVDIDNFRQVIGPIGTPADFRGARLMGRVFAAGDLPRYRCEEVASVKARRQRLRAP